MMSWKEDADCCSWDGVTCDSVTGHVIGLDLSCSWLHGNIPASNSSLFFLPRLRKLNLAYNDFNYSEISSGFINQFSSLTMLNLSFSNFTGSIPASLGNNITQLAYLDLSSNSFSGHIPSSFSNLQQLQHLDLWDNYFIGQIPASIGNNITKLVYLDVSYNNFSGRIPSSFSNLQQLQYLYLMFNYFIGQIPDLPPRIKYFSFSNNNLTGEIPLSFCNLSSIQIFLLSENSLSGQIPECLGNSTLEVLDMRMNKFSGNLPQTYAKNCVLASLNLNSNGLEGPLPPSLVNCQHLELLDVGNNQIDGTFPNWLDILPELQVLILRSNRFWGPIGDTKTRAPFPKLRIIDLSHNQLTDFLPVWYLDSFKAMMHRDNNSVEVDYMRLQNSSNNYYESAVVTVKGHDLQMERILTTFATIDLSSNKFQGVIPEAMGNLNSLKCLNISHNNLTGSIPSSFRNMTELESLDLSSNKLVGHIPTQLASLNSLSVLNLSNNLLEGPIPEGPQFNTFGNDSYFGNSGLCGFPLSERCGINEAPRPTTPRRFHKGDDDSSWFDWKFAKVGYASGVVIGLSIGYIVLATGRPQWF